MSREHILEKLLLCLFALFHHKLPLYAHVSHVIFDCCVSTFATPSVAYITRSLSPAISACSHPHPTPHRLSLSFPISQTHCPRFPSIEDLFRNRTPAHLSILGERVQRQEDTCVLKISSNWANPWASWRPVPVLGNCTAALRKYRTRWGKKMSPKK